MQLTPRILTERCTCCGLCVPACPERALSVNAAGAPELAAEVCLGCGHCLAVCPVGAIALDGETLTAAPVATLRLGDLESLLQTRRSVRLYQDRPVPRPLLERILRTTRHAPSAACCQCCEFVVLQDAEPRRAFVDRVMRRAALFAPLLRLGWASKAVLWLTRSPVSDATDPRVVRALHVALDNWRETGSGFFHDAPVIIIVHTRPDGIQATECACYAAYHIVLAAEAAGLGSCIIGFGPPMLAKMRRLRRELGVPRGNRVQVVLTLGYPSEAFHVLPPRAPLRATWL